MIMVKQMKKKKNEFHVSSLFLRVGLGSVQWAGSWVCGSVGLWVRGLVGPWVRGLVGPSVHRCSNIFFNTILNILRPVSRKLIKLGRARSIKVTLFLFYKDQ